MRLPEIRVLKLPVATGRIKTWTVDGYVALPADHPNRSLAKVVACRALYRGDVSIKGAADRFATLESLCLADRGTQDFAMAEYEGQDREAVNALLMGSLGDMSQVNWTRFVAFLDRLRAA